MSGTRTLSLLPDRELDAICQQLWRESLRRTEAGSLIAAS
jgi:hypothetical protein